VDIVDILPSINVPTLMMQRVNDIDVKIEEGRFIAERIKGAKFVEFDGNDHLFWAGNTQEVLSEMMTFIQNLQLNKTSQRQLLTIVVAKIFSNVSSLNKSLWVSINPEQIDTQLIQKYRGTLHYLEGNTCIATFEGPNKAIHCSIDFQNTAKALNMHLKVGIHVGECLMEDGKLVTTSTIDTTKKIQRQAQADQILVSQAVKNLLPVGGLKFSKYLPLTNDLIPPIYAVKDKYSTPLNIPATSQNIPTENGFLLESVLQCIDNNLDNEQFGVEILCTTVGLSERQLQRKLKAISNKSPNQMIRSVRLHRAKGGVHSIRFF